MGMDFSKHKDYLRYEKNARNLFLHCVQLTSTIKDEDNPSRFLYAELSMTGVAGITDETKTILREAIAVTKRMLPTFQHSRLSPGKDLIANADFNDAVRMVLLVLEEMEGCPTSES